MKHRPGLGPALPPLPACTVPGLHEGRTGVGAGRGAERALPSALNSAWCLACRKDAEARALVVESNLWEPYEDRDRVEFRWACEGLEERCVGARAPHPPLAATAAATAGRPRRRQRRRRRGLGAAPAGRPVSALEWMDEDGDSLPAFVADALHK